MSSCVSRRVPRHVAEEPTSWTTAADAASDGICAGRTAFEVSQRVLRNRLAFTRISRRPRSVVVFPCCYSGLE